MTEKSLECNNDCEDNELTENTDINEGINRIVVKPIVKIDVNISGLNTGTVF